MKIVILADGIPPEGKGGAERIAWQSAVALQKEGNDVYVITTRRAPQARVSESIIEGVKIFSIPSSYHVRWRAWVSLNNPKVVREVRKILKEIQPDIVHAHNVHQYLSYASLSAARAAGARVFLTIHDAMPFNYDKLTEFRGQDYKISAWRQFLEQRFRYNPFRNYYIRLVLEKVDVRMTVSHALADALAQNGIKDVQVHYNGIDEKKWTVSVDAEQATGTVHAFIGKHSLANKKVILFGGRITGTKGGDALLAALPEITKAIPEIVLLIMGTENTYVQSLQKRAEASGIGMHLQLTGWITGDELVAAYHTASLIAVPSLYLDPLPTVVLEAMACAKPVIGSCLGGIPEMVEDGVTGYVVHPLDTENLAAKIIELLDDGAKATAFGNAGAQRQQEKFSEATQTRLLVEIYRKSQI